jgi:cytochrome c oxidase subunit II
MRPQSALDPAGHDAQLVADLFLTMAFGALVVWIVTVALFLLALHQGQPWSRPKARGVIGIGGVIVPVVALTALLARGLWVMPSLLDPGPSDGVRIEVMGEQWWWRVTYRLPDGRSAELANEVRLPVGKRLPVHLSSADVIHSFWVPSLSGKRDAFPGRATVLGLEPVRTGVFRGTCAEYCGSSHTEMNFVAVALDPPAFDAWLAAELEPAVAPPDVVARRGAAVFEENGCGACHTVRGTASDGRVGPDLTHVGSRHSIGAGLLPNDADAFATFITGASHLKPDVYMPTFDQLPERDVHALARWLDGLR